MVSLKEKYTDINYANKAELTDLLEYHAIETVWKEILEYRQAFQIHYQFLNQSILFTLTPSIYQKVIETERDLRQQVLQMGNSSLFLGLVDRQQFEYKLKEFLAAYYGRDYDLQQQLMHTHPLILVSILRLLKVPEASLLANDVLQMYHLSSISEDVWEIAEMLEVKEGNDQTAFLLQYMKQLQAFCESLSTKVNTQQDKTKSEGVSELCWSYPNLSQSLITFFVEHRAGNHFYSVKDYQDWHECSYETARSSLNELVNLGWYQKIKVGKKFVYGIK